MYKKILIFILIFTQIQLAFAALNISDISADPMILFPGQNTTISANVSDDTLDKVIINITDPNYNKFNYEMNNTYDSIFEYVYTPTIRGTYEYSVCANDTSGNSTCSDSNYFFLVRPYTNASKNITINVEVLAYCHGIIATFGFPSKVFQNQTVVFVIIFENNGNIPLTSRTFYLEILNYTGHVIKNYENIGYVSGTIDIGGFDFYWNEWDTTNIPLGNYTAVASVVYRSMISKGNVYFENFNKLNESADCLPLNETDNTTVCTQIRNVSCSYIPSGSPIIVETTNNSSVIVKNMKNGTIGYEGLFELDNVTYNSYNFQKSVCTDYCYSCISQDDQLNETEECAYENYTINYTYYVYNIDPNGMSVIYKEASLTCNQIEKIWNCTVYPNNSAFCIEDVNCYGITRREHPFEVLNATQTVEEEVETPKPEPSPTPSPEPTPEKEPEPETGAGPEAGQTQISVEIEPLEKNIWGYQGDWIPSVISIKNIGNVNVTDIIISTMVPIGWEKKDAEVSFLDVGEEVNRTVFVKPSYTALGNYVIPVRALRGNVTLDIDYFWVDVYETANKTRLEILEVPRTINMKTNSEIRIPVLLKNIGLLPLHNISARLENAEDCLENYTWEVVDFIENGTTKSSSLIIRSKNTPGSCPASLIVWSQENAYAFSDININVMPVLFILRLPKTPILMLVLILLEFILLKIKKAREYEEMETGIVNVFVHIVLIVTIMCFIYVFLWYFRYVENLI